MLSLDLTSLCACCLGWPNFGSRSRLFCDSLFVHIGVEVGYKLLELGQYPNCVYVTLPANVSVICLLGSGIVCSLSFASSFTFNGVLKAC
jgi:hypothetical protein